MKILKQKSYPKVGAMVEGVATDHKGVDHILVVGRIKGYTSCEDKDPCIDRMCIGKKYASLHVNKDNEDYENYENGLCLHYYNYDDDNPNWEQWRLQDAKEDRRRTDKEAKAKAKEPRLCARSESKDEGEVA